jgi:hypothetical protein
MTIRGRFVRRACRNPQKSREAMAFPRSQNLTFLRILGALQKGPFCNAVSCMLAENARE